MARKVVEIPADPLNVLKEGIPERQREYDAMNETAAHALTQGDLATATKAYIRAEEVLKDIRRDMAGVKKAFSNPAFVQAIIQDATQD